MKWSVSNIEIDMDCENFLYPSLIYKTGPGSSFPNLGTGGDYPLTVTSEPSYGGGHFTVYRAKNLSIPRFEFTPENWMEDDVVRGMGVHTVIIREFGNSKRLCDLVAPFTPASHEAIYATDGAELVHPLGTGLYQGGHAFDAGTVSANAAKNDIQFSTLSNTRSYMWNHSNGGLSGLSGDPFNTEYDDYPWTSWPSDHMPPAATCKDALVGPCIMAELLNTGMTTRHQHPPDYFSLDRYLYIDGVKVRSYCCVDNVALLADYQFGNDVEEFRWTTALYFGVSLWNTEDPTWSDSVKGFAMFRRFCEPFTVDELPGLIAVYQAA